MHHATLQQSGQQSWNSRQTVAAAAAARTAGGISSCGRNDNRCAGTAEVTEGVVARSSISDVRMSQERAQFIESKLLFDMSQQHWHTLKAAVAAPACAGIVVCIALAAAMLQPSSAVLISTHAQLLYAPPALAACVVLSSSWGSLWAARTLDSAAQNSTRLSIEGAVLLHATSMPTCGMFQVEQVVQMSTRLVASCM